MKPNHRAPLKVISGAACLFLVGLLNFSSPGLGRAAGQTTAVAAAQPQNAAWLSQVDPCLSPANPVVAENCKPGTADWQITKILGDIEGYASLTSVSLGQPIDFYINTSAQSFDLFIYRSGYYQGKGGRLVQTVKGLTGQTQPACRSDSSTGLASCSNWQKSFQLSIPEDWVSGVYIAKLIRADTGGENFILFVVRKDLQRSDIVLQVSVTTYQAYNYYGNKSLYSSISPNVCYTIANAPRAVKVSFNRPNSIPPVMQNSFFWTDYPLVFWFEAQGYDVSYITNLDTHRYGKPGANNELLNHKLFISAGHDEYWTQEMHDAVVQARDAGVHLAFFSSNVSYWRIRFEPDPWTGEPDRVMVTYKTTESGSPDPSGHPTTTWRDPKGVDDPENSLVGIQYIGDNGVNYFPLMVSAQQAKDPIFRNTGLQELQPGSYANIGKHLIGWEWDAVVDNGHTPDNLVVLASSPVYGELLTDAGRIYNYGKSFAQVTRYTAASGAIVFASGTNNWGWGLAIYEPNRYLQQITYNLLADMGIHPYTPFNTLVLDGDKNNSNDLSVSKQDPRGETDPVLIGNLEDLLKIWAVGDFTEANDGLNQPVSSITSSNPISQPPVISNVKITPTYNTARISWNTNVEADGQVWIKYASGSMDFSISGSNLGARPVAAEGAHEAYQKEHVFLIPGLQPNTKYYVQIASGVVESGSDISDEISFSTNGDAPLPVLVKSVLRPTARQVRCVYTQHQNLSIVIGAIFGLVIVVLVLWFVISRFRKAHKIAPV